MIRDKASSVRNKTHLYDGCFLVTQRELDESPGAQRLNGKRCRADQAF